MIIIRSFIVSSVVVVSCWLLLWCSCLSPRSYRRGVAAASEAWGEDCFSKTREIFEGGDIDHSTRPTHSQHSNDDDDDEEESFEVDQQQPS